MQVQSSSVCRRVTTFPDRLFAVRDLGIFQYLQRFSRGASVRRRKPPLVRLTYETLEHRLVPTTDPGITVEFGQPGYYVNETAATATITVELNQAATNSVSVHFASSDDTATADTDYTPTSGTLVFPAGTVLQTFTVGIINDDTTDADKDLNLTLSRPDNATLGSQSTSNLTILEDGFTIPTASSGANYLTVGPDNAVYFTETAANQIGKLTPAGTFTEFTIPTSGSGPLGITTVWTAASGLPKAPATKLGP